MYEDIPAAINNTSTIRQVDVNESTSIKRKRREEGRDCETKKISG